MNKGFLVSPDHFFQLYFYVTFMLRYRFYGTLRFDKVYVFLCLLFAIKVYTNIPGKGID